MMAISLWQPWASFMADGHKHNETRSWPTNFRGDLAICAAKRKPRAEEFPDCATAYEYQRNLSALPLGMIVCVVELYECVPTRVFYGLPTPHPLLLLENQMGDYTMGRYAWLTKNCRKLKRPIPIIGRQGLFELPPGVEQAIRADFVADK
jgi:hypothetical protein